MVFCSTLTALNKDCSIKVHLQARAWGLQMGGARFPGNGSQQVKSACAAEFFTKNGVKSTVLELQKSYKHKSSCTINFLKNET